MDLFSSCDPVDMKKPLAEDLRPQAMDDVLLSEDSELKSIYHMWKSGKKASFLLCGPAGSGKTSFIKILYDQFKGRREQVNAVDVGIPRLRELLKASEENFQIHGEPTLLFIDEVHRLKAPQQDILLPGLERGSILLLAATTESPGLRFNRAFLSRLRVVRVEPLSLKNLEALLVKGLTHLRLEASLSPLIEKALLANSDGDGRKLLGDLYAVVSLFKSSSGDIEETAALKYLNLSVSVAGSKQLRVDALSAFIKSMRASDERASVYYMGLLLEAKEDPEVMLRRMLVFSSEDVGNANPQAVVVISAIWESFTKVGLPESLYSLYQGCSYLAKSPKSRRHVDQKAWIDQTIGGSLEGITIPAHLKNYGPKRAEGDSNLPEQMSEK